MSEPGKISAKAMGGNLGIRTERTKSIAEVRNQANRIQQEIINRFTPNATNDLTRYRNTEQIAQQYINNMMDSPTMRRLYRGEGAREIQIPQSEYMRRNRG